MAKDTTFVVGTIVEAEWLNELQEVDTGLMWGLNLNQDAADIDKVNTAVAGDISSAGETRSSIVINGQRRWLSGPGSDALVGGVSGTRNIVAYVDDDDDLNPGPGYPNSRDFNLEVIPVGNVPSGTYSRIVGTGEWNSGTSRLQDIRLVNGVQASALQRNAFQFESIGTIDTILELNGKTTQNNSLYPLLSVGADTGGGVTHRYHVYGSGQVGMTPDNLTDVVQRSLVSGDTSSRFQLTGAGVHTWGDGGAGVTSLDVSLYRLPAPGTAQTLRLEGSTGGGIFDTTYFQNSNSTSAPLFATDVVGANNFLSPVNFMDDVYLDGVLINLSNLAHLDIVETFIAAHTFAAQLNMANTYNFVFQGNGQISMDLNSSSTNTVFSSSVSGDTSDRFSINANGDLTWTDGAGSAAAVLRYLSANILELPLGDQIRVHQNPFDDDDLARKKYVDDQDIAYASGQRAFSFFIGR